MELFKLKLMNLLSATFISITAATAVTTAAAAAETVGGTDGANSAGIELSKGLSAILSFLPELLLGGLLPAFLIAAAIKTFIPDELFTRYLTARKNPVYAYLIASVTGILFAACACGVLPLFASIYETGAGIGPAMTFLVAGPAINFLAILLTWQFFGLEMMAARLLCAFGFSISIGLFFSWWYHGDKADAVGEAASCSSKDSKLKTNKKNKGPKPWYLVPSYKASAPWKKGGLFAYMVLAMLVLATPVKSAMEILAFWGLELSDGQFLIFKFLAGALTVGGSMLYAYLAWDRICPVKLIYFTWHFFKKIAPHLLIGVAIIKMLEVNLNQQLIAHIFDSGSFTSNLSASVIGTMMYFGTCVSVVIVESLKIMGMGTGPQLALFMSGPVVSLPALLALTKIIGWRKSALYAVLIIVLSTFAGMIYGSAFPDLIQ